MASPFTPPTLPGSQGYPLGLTGATSATRFVGATASGAPASGTFAVGDFAVSQAGVIYVCTVAGSPGTWVAVGGSVVGNELAYVEITADVTSASTSEASPTDVMSAGAIAFDGATRICIEFSCASWTNGVNGITYLNLWRDSTDLGRIGRRNTGSQGSSSPFLGRRYLTPSAGTFTYSIKTWHSTAAGTVIAVSPWLPASLRITVVDSV